MTCQGCKWLATIYDTREGHDNGWLCLVDWELTKPGDECRTGKRKESTQNDKAAI